MGSVKSKSNLGTYYVWTHRNSHNTNLCQFLLHLAINRRIFFLFLGYKQSTISPKRCVVIQLENKLSTLVASLQFQQGMKDMYIGSGGINYQCKISLQIVLNTDTEKWGLFAKALWHSGMWHMFKCYSIQIHKRKNNPQV